MPAKKYWIACLLTVFLLLRLPALVEPLTYGDEAIYLTLGQSFRKGLTLYKEIHDNKPPFIYLLAGLAGNFFRYRLLAFFWAGGTVFAFHQLVKKLFPRINNPFFLTFIFTILISLPLFEGNIANAENFMILPTILGYLAFLKNHFFLSGLFFSLATLFKMPAGFDFAAVVVLSLVISKAKKIVPLILGFITPIVLSFAYYAFGGALGAYFKAAFWQNIFYLSSWSGNQQPSLIKPVCLLGVCLFIFFFRKKLNLPVKLIGLWFFFSLFAALLSSRPYPHYLLQVIPALVLAIGLAFSRSKTRLIPLGMVMILAAIFLGYKFWYYPVFEYYQNFYSYLTGIQTKKQYFNYFNSQAESIYQTASYVRERTLSDEKIFVWGDQPSIYALSKRSPVGRYTVAYHIIDFKGFGEVMDHLAAMPPRYIIDTHDSRQRFPELNTFISENYAVEQQFGRIDIFHRLSKAL